MWQDIIDINGFYASRLGQVARRMIRRRLRGLWPDVRGLSVLGLGFATPYLRQFNQEAERVASRERIIRQSSGSVLVGAAP